MFIEKGTSDTDMCMNITLLLIKRFKTILSNIVMRNSAQISALKMLYGMSHAFVMNPSSISQKFIRRPPLSLGVYGNGRRKRRLLLKRMHQFPPKNMTHEDNNDQPRGCEPRRDVNPQDQSFKVARMISLMTARENTIQSHNQTDSSQTHGKEKTMTKTIYTNGAIIRTKKDIPLKRSLDSKAIFSTSSKKKGWHNVKKI